MTASLPAGTHPRIAAGYAYWRSLQHEEGRLPGRKAIDPVEMRGFLPDVCLYDVQHSPVRFRNRLVGTRVVAGMRHDFTGRWLDEVYPRFVTSPAYAEFVGVARRELPIAYYRGIPLFHTDRDYTIMERILLPLATDGDSVDMLFAIIVFDPLLTKT